MLRSSADDTPAPHDSCVVPLTEFVSDFGDSLLAAVTQQNPPVYDGTFDYRCDAMTENLKRNPFAAQRGVVQAVTRLLVLPLTGSRPIRGDCVGRRLISCCEPKPGSSG